MHVVVLLGSHGIALQQLGVSLVFAPCIVELHAGLLHTGIGDMHGGLGGVNAL